MASDNPEAVKALIEARARVNVLDGDNRSPLWHAVADNNPDSVVALCNAGADPDLGTSPLTSSGDDIKALIKSLCE